MPGPLGVGLGVCYLGCRPPVLSIMSQNKPTVEIKPVASFSDVLQDKTWGPDLRKAAEVGSVAVVQSHEQPSVEQAPTAPKPRRPR